MNGHRIKTQPMSVFSSFRLTAHTVPVPIFFFSPSYQHEDYITSYVNMPFLFCFEAIILSVPPLLLFPLTLSRHWTAVYLPPHRVACVTLNHLKCGVS